MNVLPPPIMTSEKATFARKTIELLKPGIINNLLSECDYPPGIRIALNDLKFEMANGRIKPLQEKTDDKHLWDTDIAPFIGNSWLELPWLLAEAFFFRRILEATQFFQPGPWQEKDPFQHLKNEEFRKALQPFSEAYQPKIARNNLVMFQNACYQALWGNQSDLSNLETYDTKANPHMEKLIFNQSVAAHKFLQEHSPARIAYFFDNVGRELYFDLAFINYLLQSKLALSITGYLKNQPFFVSDAQPKDLHKAINLLGSSPNKNCERLAERISNWINSGIISLKTPPFLTSSRSFREIPGALEKELRDHDFTIMKGDVNFRRLVGDRHWDPTTPLKIASGYFYTPFMSLRTLKSELIIGLTKDRFIRLESQAEKDWLINGKRGMIIFLDK